MRGALTELVGTQKDAGKTTFLIRGLVLAVLQGRSFLGLVPKQGPVFYLTEQPPTVVRKDLEAAGLLDQAGLYILQWCDVPSRPWKQLAGEVRKDARELKPVLLVIDTIPQFALQASESENDSAAALAALRPVQLIASDPDGPAVVVVRHERKAGGSTAKAGRGNGAWAGAVDVMLRLRRKTGKGRPTVRLLEARSRFSETPEETLIELTNNGYVLVDKAREEEVMLRKGILHALASASLSLVELVEVLKKPRTSIEPLLSLLVEDGTLSTNGTSAKGSLKRYCVQEIS